jgi:glycine/D-amino acid oxidase-like deaminating enzyme
MRVDYIIVGLGLAGLAFTRKLELQQKSFIVFEDNSQNSSGVASGMYNPVVLKRFTPVWNGTSQLDLALPFYRELEIKFERKFHFPLNIYRVFKSVEEQNNWFSASDNPLLAPYMIPDIIHEKFHGVKAEFGFGKLKNTGRIDSQSLLMEYRKYLLDNNVLKMDPFNYQELEIEETGIKYHNLNAKCIVFCEGFGLKQNPYFNFLPMREAKGELLVIYAPKLKVDFLIKAAVFLMPLGQGYYKVGATFNWKDKSKLPTEEGKRELIQKLDTVIEVPYKIVEHMAGIRPTVKDRRPLVGRHPKFKNLAILNGLGTRGIMIAPTAAKSLYEHLEMGTDLDKEIAIARFL